MAKVAFICKPTEASFITDIAKFISQFHEVKELYTYDGNEVYKALEWADIIWQEWADDYAVATTNHFLVENKKVIIRLHSYEALSGYIAKINWRTVDHLIFVADNVRRISLPQLSNLNITNNFNIWTIPNGVDLKKFKLTKDLDNSRKIRGRNIAYIGTITNKKGPMLMIQAFEKLVCEDETWRLHIAGDIVDMRYEVYLNHIINEMGLNDFITFCGHQNNIVEWLKNMHYVACSSPWESQNMSVMEAMATGCCPLVHNFPGAKQIYPEEFVWTTVNEFADLVLSLPWEPEKYRKIIEDRYDLVNTNNEIKKVFDELDKGLKYGQPIQIHH